jgi:hypothetical protein
MQARLNSPHGMSAQHVANVALSLARLPHACRAVAPSAATLEAMQQHAQHQIQEYNGQALSNLMRYFAINVRRAKLCDGAPPGTVCCNACCPPRWSALMRLDGKMQGQPPKPCFLATVCNQAAELMQRAGAMPIMSVSYLVSLVWTRLCVLSLQESCPCPGQLGLI